MSNTQPITAIDHSSPENLLVHSMFYTLQGEGPFTGHPCVFVRLAGCNLQCPGCDTEYTQNAVRMTPEQIVLSVLDRRKDASLVVITGGEPFRQDITSLVALLQVKGIRVQIETNGVMPLPARFARMTYPELTTIIVSPKTGRVHKTIREAATAWKYVLQVGNIDPTDGLPIQALENPLPKTQLTVARPDPGKPVYITPMDEHNPMKDQGNLRAVVYCALKFGYIGGIQLHKHLELE